MLFEACLTVEIGVGSVDFFGFLQQSLSPAMTYEALVDVDDAHLAELNIGLHTIHEVAKCIMSAKGDNTSFPPSFQPFGKHLMLTSHDSSAFSNMSKRPTCSSEHSVLPLLTWS